MTREAYIKRMAEIQEREKAANNIDWAWLANGSYTRIIGNSLDDLPALREALSIAVEACENIQKQRNKECWKDGCTCPFDFAAIALERIFKKVGGGE